MLSICRGALGNLVALALAMGCSSGGGDGDKTVVDAEVRQILDAEVDARPPLDLGIVEECAADETRPCGFDLGVCRAGIQRCVQGLWSVDCEGVVGPVDERCDGIDNDCDESTDEGFALGGACKYDDERGIPQDGVTACDHLCLLHLYTVCTLDT
jgi:hypothetical protein